MNDETLITFGKYKGTKLSDVPDEYLLWLYDNNKCFGELKAYILENLEAIKANVNRTINR